MTDQTHDDLRRPIDVHPGAETDPIDYWEGDVRDFADVGWALRNRSLIEDTDKANAISEAYRGSRAVQATALQMVAQVILDPDRLATILAAVPAAAQQSAAQAARENQPQMAGSHLIAAVATVVRDTPKSDGFHNHIMQIINDTKDPA